MVLNYILLEITILKKVVYIIKFYLQFLCVAGCLKQINDTPKLNINKYTNYNIIEIYINRLSIITQTLMAMYCLIMMSVKYLYFKRRKKKTFCKGIFSHLVEVSGSMYSGNIFGIMCFTKICTKTWMKLE